MIIVDNKPLNMMDLESEYPSGNNERKVLAALAGSDEEHIYESLEQLKFEIELRIAIIDAAKALYLSGLGFDVFRDTRCNNEYWTRRDDGGFVLKPGMKASDAILDIYQNGSEYSTECATAMQIVYYKALLELFPEDVFNNMFPTIVLMNWHDIARELRETGHMQQAKGFIPGDRLYFANPDVDPKTPEWQGENVIDLGNGTYYGHGIGIHEADGFISVLNENRRESAGRTAYLMDLAGRPDFTRLYTLYERSADVALTPLQASRCLPA